MVVFSLAKRMEVLPCSDVQYVGESDAQQSSGTGFVCSGDSSSIQSKIQVQMGDGTIREPLLSVQEPSSERLGEVQGADKELLTPEGNHSAVSCSGVKEEDHISFSDFHDFENGDLDSHNFCIEPTQASESSDLVVDTIESEPPTDGREGEPNLTEPKCLEHDETMALWVKWRGKWQAGIRCARPDWPLSTLRAKPTHDRKQYFVVFFPHTRNYSWADMLLVRSINEFPHPIAYKTHKVGLKMVKDLTIARRYIMQKLAVAMLNVIDQFHSEALIESARDVTVWKDFAMEASRCTGYSDLGRMLLKLQNMILKNYINSSWLQNSFPSWMQRCQSAGSAESVELLKEELYEAILWNEVNSLSDAPVQPTLGSEWRTWKHEVMKWFSTSHPLPHGGDVEHRSDGTMTISPQANTKRAKLEVRRAESHAFQVDNNDSSHHLAAEIDFEVFSSQNTANAATFSSEPPQQNDIKEVTTGTNTPVSVADRWDKMVVDAGNSEVIPTKDVELTPMSEEAQQSVNPLNRSKELALIPVTELGTKKSLDFGSKNRQCTAFIESKGRQCVRWANEGDVYCCVHLASRFMGSATKAEGTLSSDSPMCEGTTVLGTKCKHRALYGFSFCKKHRPKDDALKSFDSPDTTLKRKHEETTSLEATSCKDMILVGEAESPLDVDPVSVMDGNFIQGRNILIRNPETQAHHCIGLYSLHSSNACDESPKRHSLYCDKHLPSWLKRARNGKSRIISKEVFVDLLSECHSLEQKLCLHQACELFYKLFKSILSLRNPVPMDIQLQWAISEASRDVGVGEFLMKLVSCEKKRLNRIWGFGGDKNAPVSSGVEESTMLPLAADINSEDDKTIKCKICSHVFLNDQELGSHWMENHKKEAQWYFRGYACAICLDSFTNKKILESHVQERHRVQFVEQCMLLQCIPCGSHFGNSEELWLHVLSVHPVDFRTSKTAQQYNLSGAEDSPSQQEPGNSASLENHTKNGSSVRRFICKLCGLKFDLLPDLGRHHQAAHMGPNLITSRGPRKGIRFLSYKLKSGRLSRPRFKKGFGAVSYRIRNRTAASMKKRIQASKSLVMGAPTVQTRVSEGNTLGKLAESQCSVVSNLLFSEIQKTKPWPNNHDILSIARLACCKVSLKASLEEKYGVLPECLYLKAAKLCSENNIQVEWHQDGFICPNGCKIFKDLQSLSPLLPLSSGFMGKPSAHLRNDEKDEWETDEGHYVVDSHHLGSRSLQNATLLTNDISCGKESVQIACIVDDGLLDSLCIAGDNLQSQNSRLLMPWESFTYVTKLLLDQCHDLEPETLQLGCACHHSTCYPETCDHVYLFDNDYADAKDIYGRAMRGRFPYDQKGRIIIEEGYLVYECNHLCSCNRTCPNRVLQNGVQVKLEVFKTEKKGWAVRAGETILRGTFVCEFIGEVIDEPEANKRRDRYGRDGCGYMFNVDSHVNDMGRLIEGQAHYVIDATKYGNVSRFINHSCSPNLMNFQVLVDSMDCQRAHIGLYANQDISLGEELTYDYHYEFLTGEGYPCHCEAPNCRKRLY